ncbi:uncharacterized protein EI97DRAFT_465677 [Westerdykella ornata]|uniref:Programmed cell death protein 2 C-terminal domain-containing protein n=1 Tax=Westerdykella ornata TaxID=318751 RepID=A0A6A6JPP8_WESOR|nr:uncharacterized protein EI97DRAFT_465677 [Westerdykella ornata]KAF2278357.1 hypothetical protein EI97DRAFT_465677 [Westerdykella ornata]
MPPYDSDSSDEGEDYTETNVLLGYVTNEPTSDKSHLGGTPTWIDDKTAPSGAFAKCKVCNGLMTLLLELDGNLPEQFPGHERRLYIWACKRKACRRKDGSVRGIRGVRIAKGAGSRAVAPKSEPKPEKQEEPKPMPQIGGSLFGVKDLGTPAAAANLFSNPFSIGASGKAPANPFSSPKATVNPFSTSTPSTNNPVPEASPSTSSSQLPPSGEHNEPSKSDSTTSSLPETFASKVRLNSPPTTPSPTPRPHEPWPTLSSFPQPYPSYALDAEYETLDAPSSLPIPAQARMDIDAEGSSSSGGGGKEDKEIFESTLDKTFQKFADRVGQNAEQVIRYEFGGKPLLYSDQDAVGKMLAAHADNASSNAKVTTAGSRNGSGMPRCANCGAERVFEVQLMPHAITELEADEMSIEGMEWGTIILGVCSRDCKPQDVAEGEVGYLEEWVGVQWEEVASKR